MDTKTDEKQLSGLILPSEEGEENRSGLVLNTQSEQDRLEELKKIGKEEGAQKVKQFEAASQPAANTPAPQPQASSNNANPVLQSKIQSAQQELEKQHWNQARRLYDDILDAEPENAEANLGMLMAIYWIQGKKYIPEVARNELKKNRDIFRNTHFVRARRYADDNMKKELESYEKGRDYLIAIEEFQRAKTIEDYQEVSKMFDRLGDFADSRKQKKDCDGHWQKPLYDSAVQSIKSAWTYAGFIMIADEFEKLGDYEDAREQKKLAEYLAAVCVLQEAKESKYDDDFFNAKRMFEELGDYSDSKEKIKECEEGIKQRQGQKEVYQEYEREYEKFEKEVADLQEVRQHKSKIASQRARISSLRNKRTVRLFKIQMRWIFIMGGLGLLCYLVPAGMLKLLCWSSGEGEQFVIEGIRGDIFYAVQNFGFLGGFFKTIKWTLPLLAIALIPAFIISCVVAGFNDTWEGYCTFFGIMLSVLLLPPIGLFILAYNYVNQVRFIGKAALLIAVAIIAAKGVRKVMAGSMPKLRAAEIKQLEQSIDDEYEQIKKFIGREYQKIYDRYPIIGSRRKEVSAVQKQLMEKIKKNN